MRYAIAIVVLAVLAIIGVVVISNRTSTISNTSTNQPKARVTKLADYENNDNAAVTYTEQGRIVGEDQFKAIRVTVTRNKRTVEVLSGYEERVEKTQEYANTPAAFSSFVRALDHASFGAERNVAQTDDRGVCPTGRRYIYRLTDAGKEVMRTWSDNCKAADGPSGAVTSQIRNLFQAQITDYSKFVSGTRL